jgi:hypothetical protein
MEQGYVYKSPLTKQSTKTKPQNIEKYLIWHIQGGLGKNIAATALIKDLKAEYSDRKLIMVVSHPEVFINNPNIDRVYQLGQTPYFYQDYIYNKDVIIFRHEPYHQTGHITKTKHLIENWCDLLGLAYKMQKPEIFVNYMQRQSINVWNRSQPIMVIQTNGGPGDIHTPSYSWTRDMPINVAQHIVDRFKHDYHIIQITKPDGYFLEGVERFDAKISNMELFALLVVAQKRVLIDSCLQHAAAAFNLPSTVLWIGTSPTVFGYDMHTNIEANLPETANQLIGSYLFDYQFDNNDYECPYINIEDIFNIEYVFNKI